MPGEIPGKYPDKSPANTRQIPGSNGLNWAQIPDEMPEVETLSGAEQFDQSTGLEELWRIEKDGENRYRWRLRFAAGRPGRPGGKITPAIRRKLKKRPGKGRHAESREVAARFRDRAEYLAEQLRKVSELRVKGASRGKHDDRRNETSADNSNGQREPVSEVQELDTWANVSDVLM
jgi:hypothetical protein